MDRLGRTMLDEKRTVNGQPEILVKVHECTFPFETQETTEKFAVGAMKYMLEVVHTRSRRILIVSGRMTGKKEIQKTSEIIVFETLIEETRKKIPLRQMKMKRGRRTTAKRKRRKKNW